MNWKAFLQTLISGAVNVGLGVAVHHLTGSVPLTATVMGAGTVLAHGTSSPYDANRLK